MKNVAAGANPMVVKKGIQKAVDTAVETMLANSQKITCTADIGVLLLFLPVMNPVGKLIGEAMEKSNCRWRNHH